MSTFRRRELIAAAGAGAVALTVPAWARAKIALPDELAKLPVLGPIVGSGLRPELITVTQRGFVAWWQTQDAADTTVRLARDGEPMREVTLARGRTVHAASIGGLRPGVRYRYELVSGGRVLAGSSENPGTLRTLDVPPGRRLARVAVLNDLHVGEGCSGTITSATGSSVPECFRADDYAGRMTQAAVDLCRSLDVDAIIANGDLTDRGKPEDIRRCLAILRGARVPLLVTRGNHDRTLAGAEGCGSDGDCLRTFGFPDRRPGDHALTSTCRVGRRVALVGLDSCDPGSGEGRLDLGDQAAFLERALTTARRERRTAIVAFHHPVTDQAITTAAPPLIFGVRPGMGGREVQDVIARHPHVALVLHGHTHRNYVSYDVRNPNRLPYLENGAAKEYPGGIAVLDVHEGGLTRTFHRMDGAFAREWIRTSAGQVEGRQPEYTRGPLSSRAFTLRQGRTGPPPTALGPYDLPLAVS